jgi:hypothetical protein
MAITQERVIAILSAFRRTYETSNTIKRSIRDISTSLTSQSSIDDFREAIQSLQFLTELHAISESDLSLLVAEEQHFRAAFRKNQRTAAYARRKRAGIPSGISFSSGKQPSTISRDISDEEKAAHYEHAEHAVSIGLTTPDQFSELKGKNAPTSPHSMLKAKPVELLTSKKPKRSTTELSTSDMIAKGWMSRLQADKMAQDAKRREVNMPPVYDDPSDDSIPLTLDDQIALGYVDPSNCDEGVF